MGIVRIMSLRCAILVFSTAMEALLLPDSEPDQFLRLAAARWRSRDEACREALPGCTNDAVRACRGALYTKSQENPGFGSTKMPESGLGSRSVLTDVLRELDSAVSLDDSGSDGGPVDAIARSTSPVQSSSLPSSQWQGEVRFLGVRAVLSVRAPAERRPQSLFPALFGLHNGQCGHPVIPVCAGTCRDLVSALLRNAHFGFSCCLYLELLIRFDIAAAPTLLQRLGTIKSTRWMELGTDARARIPVHA